MIKKTLTAILVATTLFGFNANSFAAYTMCRNIYENVGADLVKVGFKGGCWELNPL